MIIDFRIPDDKGGNHVDIVMKEQIHRLTTLMQEFSDDYRIGTGKERMQFWIDELQRLAKYVP